MEKEIFYTAEYGTDKASLHLGITKKELMRRLRECEKLERRRQDSWQITCRKYMKTLDPEYRVSLLEVDESNIYDI